MNQKLVFCITFLVIICCDAGVSSAAVENSVGDFDDANKTLTIYNNKVPLMSVRLISAVPDLCTFTEVFEVLNFEAYIPDSKEDFTARTDTKVGSGAVTKIVWFIEQNVSYVVNIADYDIKQVEKIIYNNKTGKNETALVNKTVITGYHDEIRYRDVWVDHQPYGKEMKAGSVQRIRVVYHKIPELGLFQIQTVPIFRGVECSELTWWSGSWDRRRAILINNTVGDSVTDYQLRSVNLSSFNINAASARIVNDTSQLQESLWNETVDGNGNLEYVWCNFSSLPSGGWINSTYDIYYQSTPTVSSVSDGGATFEFFDDFPGSSLDTGKWTGSTGNAVVVDSICTFSSSGSWVYIYGSNHNAPFACRYYARMGNSASNNYDSHIGMEKTDASKYARAYSNPYDAGVGLWQSKDTAGVDDNGIFPIPPDYSWYIGDITVDSNNVKYYVDGSLDVTESTQVPQNLNPNMGLRTGNIKVDWILVRNFTTNEPEPWTVGSEEEYPTPTPTPTPAPITSISPAQYDELDLPLILYILLISLLYLLIAFRIGTATIELSLIYLIFAFFFLLFQTVTMSVNYIYLTLFLLLFMISIAGITLEKRSW